MQINLDRISGRSLPSTQVALKPRVIGRNLTETQAFLCPTDERLSGVRVIQYLFTGKIRAVSNHGFKTPGNFESAILEEDWRSTMNTSITVCPLELLHGARTRLSFFTSLMTTAIASDGCVNLKHPANQDGIYYTLHSIADDIETALSILNTQGVPQ